MQHSKDMLEAFDVSTIISLFKVSVSADLSSSRFPQSMKSLSLKAESACGSSRKLQTDQSVSRRGFSNKAMAVLL